MRKQVTSALEALVRLAQSPGREGETRSFVVVTHQDPPEIQKYFTKVPLRHHGRPASDFDEPKQDPAS